MPNDETTSDTTKEKCHEEQAPARVTSDVERHSVPNDETHIEEQLLEQLSGPNKNENVHFLRSGRRGLAR